MIFDSGDLSKISAADLRVIILGLKVSNFNINDEKVKNDIWKEIGNLPSAEKINDLLSREESFEDIRRRVGHIMDVISKYGKRDVYNKARYKSKTGLNPMHSVLDYVHACGVRSENKSMKKHAAWWDSIVQNMGAKPSATNPAATMDEGSGEKDTVHSVADSLIAARKSLYLSYRDTLLAIENAEKAHRGATDKREAFVLSRIIAELKSHVESMREPMRNVNMSLQSMNEFIEKEMASYVEPEPDMVPRPTDEDIKKRYDEIHAREKELRRQKKEEAEELRRQKKEEAEELRRQKKEEAEELRRQKEINRDKKKNDDYVKMEGYLDSIMRLQDEVNENINIGDVYYYESNGLGLYAVEIKNTNIDERGRLLGISKANNKQMLLHPNKLIFVDSVKDLVGHKLRDTNNDGEVNSLLQGIYTRLNVGEYPAIPIKLYRVLSARRNVFNLRRMS